MSLRMLRYVSSFYSLMVDESTDVSILKQLVLYGKSQAFIELKYLKQMKDHLCALWNYSHHSTVRIAGLKQEVMNSPELKTVKAVHVLAL